MEEMTQLNKDQFEEVYHCIFEKIFNYMVIDNDNDEIYKGLIRNMQRIIHYKFSFLIIVFL